MTQAAIIKGRLEEIGEEVELVKITTSGDERPGGAPPPETLDKARFVKEIEAALLAEEVDLAVHSAKDVPGELPDGLAIVGVPHRADPADALCGEYRSIATLPEGARVGTASLRRRSQLLASRPDLDVCELRGNVDTRLRKLGDDLELHAIVLAAAGLQRLGLAAGHHIPVTDMVPAPGQGCLMLEARTGDTHAAELASILTDPVALAELTAERAVCEALGATCETPVGARARAGLEGSMTLEAYAGAEDGSVWVRDRLQGLMDAGQELGIETGQRMLAAGAGEILLAAEEAP